MCSNSHQDEDCYMYDLVESFEEFVKKSLLAFVVGIGVIIGTILCLLRPASVHHSQQPSCGPSRRCLNSTGVQYCQNLVKKTASAASCTSSLNICPLARSSTKASSVNPSSAKNPPLCANVTPSCQRLPPISAKPPPHLTNITFPYGKPPPCNKLTLSCGKSPPPYGKPLFPCAEPPPLCAEIPSCNSQEYVLRDIPLHNYPKRSYTPRPCGTTAHKCSAPRLMPPSCAPPSCDSLPPSCKPPSCTRPSYPPPSCATPFSALPYKPATCALPQSRKQPSCTRSSCTTPCMTPSCETLSCDPPSCKQPSCTTPSCAPPTCRSVPNCQKRAYTRRPLPVAQMTPAYYNLYCVFDMASSYFWTICNSVNIGEHSMGLATIIMVVLLSFLLPNISQKLNVNKEVKAIRNVLDMMSQEVHRAEAACFTAADEVCYLHHSVRDSGTETHQEQRDLSICTSSSLRTTHSEPVQVEKKIGFFRRIFCQNRNTSHKEIAIMSYIYSHSFDAPKPLNVTAEIS